MVCKIAFVFRGNSPNAGSGHHSNVAETSERVSSGISSGYGRGSAVGFCYRNKDWRKYIKGKCVNYG